MTDSTKHNLRELDTLELFDLYEKVIKKRQEVLDLVQEFGYDAGKLVSRTFEKDIEAEYGRKILNQTRNNVERN